MTQKTKVQSNSIYVTFRQGEGWVACGPRGSTIDPPPTLGGETWLKAGRGVCVCGGNLLQAVTEQQVPSRF